MNIYENILNKRKLVNKLGGISTKLSITLLRTSLDYKTWYQTNIKTLPFDQNY